jgi:hypothetical protein
MLCGGCGNTPANTPAPASAVSPPQHTAGSDWFVDRAAPSGLRFTHVNGMSGRYYDAEIIGSGVALFDVDNDGDLDVYLVQGAPLDPGTDTGAPSHGALFRNDLMGGADGLPEPHFTDITASSGIVSRGYGMGVAAADFDNDGCTDLYLTNLGPNQLLRNTCRGTFTDVSVRSRTNDPSWSVSAAFLDYDRDGWLDLFVGNYLEWHAESSMPCSNPAGQPDYCSPNVYMPQPSRLYHNDRDGRFTDVSGAAGIAREFGPALGVSTADFDGDRWPDIYVANDGQPNLLWINRRDGTFANTGLISGTALSSRGKPKAGMGVDAGDYDNDGDDDLFVANLTGEGHDLYANDGAGLFEERSAASGLAGATRAHTGFGAAWIDVDGDGRLDLLTVNGAVRTITALRRTGDPFPLHQRKQLLYNAGHGRFEDATARGGAAFQLSEVGRGAAFGDIDNDGDVDALVANNHGVPRLLVNTIGNRNHWVGLRLIGGPGARDMLGARVAVTRGDGTTVWGRVHTDGSYASARDPRVVIGLGTSAADPHVRIVWPDGTAEDHGRVPLDRYTTVRQPAR